MIIRRSGIRQVVRAAGAVLLASAFCGSSFATADSSSGHQLNPGVRPGDVVILRRVEPAPINRVKRHEGPITSRVSARDSALDARRRLTGGGAISLTDERAAGVRSSVRGSMNSLYRTLGTGSQVVSGEALSGGSHRVASSLGGGRSAGGGAVAGRVTSATSGIAGSIGQALSPLTGRN